MADPSKLEMFTGLTQIDTIIRNYPAYTFDDVFFLESGFVFNLLWMIKEQNEYKERYQKIHRNIHQQPLKQKR